MYSGYPGSVAALGHSVLTGEGSGEGGKSALNSSFATGRNPVVRSVYARVLEKNPAAQGKFVNYAQGGADVASLSYQADSLLANPPPPGLVIVATIDNDISCPAETAQFDAYGMALAQVLRRLGEGLPGSKIFVLAAGSPDNDVAILNTEERAAAGGTGPCAFFDPTGRVVPVEKKRLEKILDGFEAQVTTACAAIERCYAEQPASAWQATRADLSEDLNHLNVNGQARRAEHLWKELQDAGLVPPG
ncbi:MAG: hypothetical protein ABIQ61_14180 [Ornithinibacter sp.]